MGLVVKSLLFNVPKLAWYRTVVKLIESINMINVRIYINRGYDASTSTLNIKALVCKLLPEHQCCPYSDYPLVDRYNLVQPPDTRGVLPDSCLKIDD